MTLFALLTTCFGADLKAQTAVNVGRGSYASYTPLSKSRTSEHGGDQSRLMETRRLYIADESAHLPVPTNDWWTDLIVSRYSGNLWSYPQMVNAEEYGFFVAYPKEWTADGREMTWNTKLEITGKRFSPASAVAKTWNDWGVSFLMQDNEKTMTVTMAHGIPFTWVESNNLTLQIPSDNAVLFAATGEEIVLPYTGDKLVIQKGNDAYGIYAPAGTRFERKNEVIEINFAGSRQFLSIGVLPAKEELTAFAQYAYVIPRNTDVSWAYNETTGKIASFWQLTTENLNGEAQRDVLQGFIPHHYKNATLDFGFTPYEYATPRGRMKMAAGQSFTISYDFNGMLPYFAAPQADADLTNPYQRARMLQMMTDYANEGNFGADTYWGGKGLIQMALYMSFARETGETELFELCKNRLKATMINWLTYTPGESSFFFARYNRWGGLVGYDTSYDSDTFNDHHFHYGYYIYAGALLALMDEDFKNNYGEMLTLIAKDYANWDKSDTDFPFFRTLDPWAGHSYAGGLASGNGNGQESSSEAMQSWGGLFLLGVATDNQAMRDAGIFGWTLESRAIAEYWYDRDRENIDYNKYDKPYNSNLTSQGIGWWTWFSGDPVWMHSIQWMPISPCLKYLYQDLAFAEWDYTQMWGSKEVGDWSTDPNAASSLSKESGLGNVVLSYLQIFNPDSAAAVLDAMWDAQMPIVRNTDTGGISYFITHSHRSYGDICWDIHADVPTATTYRHPQTNAYTYMVYNAEPREKTVTFYQNGVQIKQINVPANKLTVFSDNPVVSALKLRTPSGAVVVPSDTLRVEALLYDQYGASIAGAVTYSVSGGGTIAPDGLFTAAANRVDVVVTARHGTLSDSVVVRVNDLPALDSAYLSPQQAYLEVGKTLNYALNMFDQYEEPYYRAVDWAISKNGRVVKTDSVLDLDAIGVYTVSASVEGQSYSTQVYLAPKFPNIALNKTAVASSFENQGTLVVNINDGEKTTRWGSQHSNAQWVYIDLGLASYVAYVSMVWEASYASLYEIQVSDDGSNWTTVATQNGLGGTETIEVNRTTRYVRMQGLQRSSIYGYSLYEFEIYGVAPTGTTPTLSGIDLQPRSGQMKEGDSIACTVTGYDQFGDTVVVVPTFDIASGLGAITNSGVFTASKYGSTTIRATVNGQSTEAQFYIEETVKPAAVAISPAISTVIRGQSATFSAGATDQFGASLDTVVFSYALIGTGGTLNGATFTGDSVGTYRIVAIAGALSDTALVTVAELSQTNLALHKSAKASSSENDATMAGNVNDGDMTTRWGSGFSDNQYVQVDLEADYVIHTVKLFWEDSYAASYRVDVSLDEENWTTVYTDNNAHGGNITALFSDIAARYVRVWCLTRASVYGASLWELEVYGSAFYTNPQPVDIVVEPNPIVAYLGEPMQLTAGLYDQFGLLYSGSEAFVWSMNSGASVDASGNLEPIAVGDYVLTVAYGALTKHFPVRILPEKVLSRIELSPAYATATIGEALQLTARASDQYGNAMAALPVWNTTGGTVSQDGLFSAGAIGSYTVTVSVGGFSATCLIDVLAESSDNIAYNKLTTTSSGNGAAAVDENNGTRWESNHQDGPEWLLVDLANAYQLSRAEIVWEGASAADYEIQVSKDGVEWTTMQQLSGLSGARTDIRSLAGIGRYVRLWCTARSTVWGYSVWELRLYGTLMQSGQPYNIAFSNPVTELNTNQTQQYSVTVTDKDNVQIANPTLNWSVAGVGYVDANGFFSSWFDGVSTLNVSSQMASASVTVTVSAITTSVEKTDDAPLNVWVTNNRELFVEGNNIETIAVYDMTGRLVTSLACDNAQSATLHLGNARGVFILHVRNNGKYELRKVVL